MEEPQQGSHSADERSLKTGEALRALRESLGMKLGGHRRRVSDLEADLSARALTIAEEVAHEQASESQAEALLHTNQLQKLREALNEREAAIAALQRHISDAELKQLRLSAELADSRSAIEVAHADECQECSSLRAELAIAQYRAIATESQLQELTVQAEQAGQEQGQSQQTVEALQQALEELRDADCQDCENLRTELIEAQNGTTVAAEELERLIPEIERLTAELTSSQQALLELREAECTDCAQLRIELTESQTHFASADGELQDLREQAECTAQELATAEQTLEALRESQSQESSKLQDELAAAQQQATELAAELEELRIQAEISSQNLASAEQALEASREGESQENAQLRAELATAQQHVDDSAAELQELRNQIEHFTQKLLLAEQSLESLRAGESQECADLRAELAEAVQKSTVAETQIQELLSELGQSQKNLAQVQDDLNALQAAECEECHQLRDQLATFENNAATATDQLSSFESQVEQLTRDLTQSREAESQLLAQHEADDHALAEATNAAEQAQQDLTAKLTGLTKEKEELSEQLAQIQAQLTARDESASSELTWLQKEFESAEQSRKQLASEFEDLLKKHKATESSLEAATLKSEQDATSLKDAEQKIHELTHSTAHEEALEQAQRKFDLALADAQKVKRENATLQEELSRRPEQSETESAELVSLRVERDALATRVAELEANPVLAVDEDAEQQFSDLQRRFELAVDDLRRLKQENSDLQDRLASAPQGGSAPAVSSGGMDWQSQKARMLAALESEDADEQTAERRQERSTIEGTISITDRVVAEKDREIDKLKSKLKEQSSASVDTESAETQVVNKDELIQAERAKLEALQKELHNKLRTAELEISVERATLARKEADLQQKLAAAEQAQVDVPVGSDGKPRRKWLSALGIRDDDEK